MFAPGRRVGFEGWVVDQTLLQQMRPGSQTMPCEVYLLLPAVPGDKKEKELLHQIIIK